VNRRIAALVLAAGGSTRMAPWHKLLLEFDGEPLIRRVVRTASELPLAALNVVTGHKHDALAAALQGLPVRLVFNAEHPGGLASSLSAGLRSLPQDIEGAFVLLADMPLVTSAHLGLLIEAFERSADIAACVPVYRGQRGNPVLWSVSCFPALCALRGDRGGRRLFPGLGASLHEVEMPDAGVLLDVDDPAACRRSEFAGRFSLPSSSPVTDFPPA